MKHFLILLSVIAIALAGAAYAADEPCDGEDKPAAVVAADEPNADACSEEPAEAESETPAETEEPEEPEKPHVGVGLEIGVFMPASSRVRDVFGSGFVRYGLRPLVLDYRKDWRTTYDVGYYSMSRGTDSVKLIPITVGRTRAFGDTDKARQYVSLNAGTFYGDLDAPSIGAQKSGWGFNANATYGVMLRERWCIEGRYDFFDKFGGLDFSAFTVSLAVRLGNLRF